jgi:hypothetical protein
VPSQSFEALISPRLVGVGAASLVGVGAASLVGVGAASLATNTLLVTYMDEVVVEYPTNSPASTEVINK